MLSQTVQLSHMKCVPCSSSTAPLKGEKSLDLLKLLGSGWKIVDEHHLEKEYIFPDFRQGLAFTNLIGDVAEQENHHPDIYLSWGKVKVQLWTHVINGLTENDFILAAKCDEEYPQIEARACY